MRKIINLKEINAFGTLSKLRTLVKNVRINPMLYFLPSVLGLLSALFEGLTTALLLPFVQGVMTMDFGFVRAMPLLKNIINTFPRLFTTRNTGIFLLIVILISICTILRSAFRYFASLMLAYNNADLTLQLRNLIFSRYLKFGKLFFDRTNIGYLHTTITHYVGSISSLIENLFNTGLAFITLIIYITLMALISLKLTIFTIISLPLFSYSLRWLSAKIKSTSYFQIEAMNNLARQVFNILTCIPLVKLNHREDEENNEFKKLSKCYTDTVFSLSKKNLMVTPIHDMVTLAIILLLISGMVYIIVSEKKQDMVAMFLVFFYILRRAIDLFRTISAVQVAFAMSSGPIDNVSKMSKIDSDKFIISEGKRELTGLREQIEFRNLSFHYINEVPVLKNINLSIKNGMLTAIVGPTGSGKTTLVSLIVRFYDCPENSIFVDGMDIREYSLKSLMKHIAYISQEAYLFNDTIRNNICYGLSNVKEEALAEAVRKSRLEDFVMRLPERLDTPVGDRGVKLSGGEKQRIAIARALLKGSEILILDEATSSLDSVTEHLIQEAIAEAVKDKTSIVIAHRLSTIKNADKIIVLEDGMVKEEGTLKELLDKKGRFYSYWEAQKFY